MWSAERFKASTASKGLTCMLKIQVAVVSGNQSEYIEEIYEVNVEVDTIEGDAVKVEATIQGDDLPQIVVSREKIWMNCAFNDTSVKFGIQIEGVIRTIF